MMKNLCRIILLAPPPPVSGCFDLAFEILFILKMPEFGFAHVCENQYGTCIPDIHADYVLHLPITNVLLACRAFLH